MKLYNFPWTPQENLTSKYLSLLCVAPSNETPNAQVLSKTTAIAHRLTPTIWPISPGVVDSNIWLLLSCATSSKTPLQDQKLIPLARSQTTKLNCFIFLILFWTGHHKTWFAHCKHPEDPPPQKWIVSPNCYYHSWNCTKLRKQSLQSWIQWNMWFCWHFS